MYMFIINEHAGGGRGRRIYKQLKRNELFQSLDRQCFVTKGKGDATKIVEGIVQANHSIKSIVVIGGDGTLHEVINGLNDNRIPVSLIPSGSGNDFSRGFGISGRPVKILENIIANIDGKAYYFGEYTCEDQTKKHFVNCLGFGFDAEVVRHSDKPFLRKCLNLIRLGRLLYVIALLQALIKFKPFDIDIELDGKRKTITQCWMITVTNHPYFGGGMKVIPGTKIEPKYFPVLIIHSISKWKVLLLFATIFTGKHLSIEGVDLYKNTKQLSIKSKQNIAYQIDGELSNSSGCQVTKRTERMIMQGTKMSAIKSSKKAANH